MAKIKMGIVGTSGWTEMMYLRPLSSHPGVEMVAICARNPERTAKVAARYRIPSTYTDWSRMIGEASLDAVAVVTPEASHHDICVASLRAGLDVLCEKPLAANADEAWNMVRVAEETGRKTQVFFTWRWQPHYRFIKELLARGELGVPRRAELSFRGAFVRDSAYHWRLDPKMAKGTIADLGAHMFDMGNWFFGPAQTLFATSATIVDRTGIPGHEETPTNDSATILARFGPGVEAVLDVSAATPVGDRHMNIRVRIEGDAGTIECDQTFKGRDAGLVFRLANGTEPFADIMVPDEHYAGETFGDAFDFYLSTSTGVRYFVDCLAADVTPEPSFRDGALAQNAIDAAMISAAENRRVAVSS